MPRIMLRSAGMALTILVAGCGPSADDAAKTGASPQEAQALNDAAAMLDDNGQDAVIDTNAADTAGNVE